MAEGSARSRITDHGPSTRVPAWLPHTPLSTRFPLYSRSNADEVLPGPVSPLGASLSWVHGMFEGWRAAYCELGALSAGEAADVVNPCAAFRRGSFYVNVSLARVLGLRRGAGVEVVDAAFFSGRAGIPGHVPRPEDLDPDATEQAGRHLQWACATTRWPELEALRERAEALRAERPPLAALPAASLVGRAREMVPLLQEAFRVHTIATADAAVGPGILRGLLAGAPPAVVLDLMGASGDVDSEVMLHELWDLSRLVRRCPPLGEPRQEGRERLAQTVARPGGPPLVQQVRRRLDAFLFRFGSRGPDEWDLAARCWEVDPTPVLAALDGLRGRPDGDDPAVGHLEAVERRAAASRRTREALAGDAGALAQLDLGLALCGRFFSWRERAKVASIRILHEQRMAVRELGRRAADAGAIERLDDVFLLVEAELDEFAEHPASFAAELAGRRVAMAELAHHDPPYILEAADDGSAIGPGGAAAPPRPAERTGEVLVGHPGSGGVVVGRVRVLHDPREADRLAPGDVLVAARTDPAWTPLFVLVSAVVAGTGALASHTVIVCREIGLPCVVGLADAVDRLPDGALVRVDGARGTVTIL
jgi:rifampicin phosphotransferase